MSGSMRAVLQTLNMLRVIAVSPAIEGLRADAKIAAGKTSIAPTGIIVVKPF